MPETTEESFQACPRCGSRVVASRTFENGAATHTTACGERWKFYGDGSGPHRDWGEEHFEPACDEIARMRPVFDAVKAWAYADWPKPQSPVSRALYDAFYTYEDEAHHA